MPCRFILEPMTRTFVPYKHDITVSPEEIVLPREKMKSGEAVKEALLLAEEFEEEHPTVSFCIRLFRDDTGQEINDEMYRRLDASGVKLIYNKDI